MQKLTQFVFWVSILQLAGFCAAQDSAPSAPGKLVDLDGLHVHIDCSGRGRPPVIFLHGLGDYSFDWALVQSAIGEQTEACAYDRPGQAWSEPGAPPRGIITSARELHLLLRRSNIRGPYVLVGHSWGGLIARMYAHEYAKEVAGMVLVDSTHEDEYLWLNGKIIRPRIMTDEEWTDLTKPRKAAAAAPSSDDGKKEAPPRRRGAVKLSPPYDKLPPDRQKLRLWAMSLPWSKQRDEGGDTQNMRQDFVDMYKVRSQSEHSLGRIPLIVLSKTPGIEDDSDYTPDQLAWNRNLQSQLVALSTNSQVVVATHSGHHIQLDDPDLVIKAILRVVDSVKHRRPLKDSPASIR